MSRFAWEYGFVHMWEVLDVVRANPLPKSEMIIPVMVWGGPGIGKTTMIRDYCTERGIAIKEHLVAQDRHGADVAGQPVTKEIPLREFYAKRGEPIPEGLNPDATTAQTQYALPLWLPIAERDGEHGILFLDEFNRADPEVLNAYMELVGTGTITQSGYQLPRGWMIAAAANPVESRFHTKPLDPAMVDRFLHYAPGTQMSNWTRWAEDRGQIQPQLIDFTLGSQNDVIDISDPEFSPDIEIAATLRSVERFNALYRPDMEDRIVDAIGMGLLGEDAVERLISFRRKARASLSPQEVLGGRVSMQDQEFSAVEMIAVYESEKQRDMIRASTERAVAKLMDTPAPIGAAPVDPREAKLFRARQLMAENLYRWICAMPEPAMSGEALASVREAAPRWMGRLAQLDASNGGRLAERLGNNLASVRRLSRREMQAERRQLKVDDYQHQGVFAETERFVDEMMDDPELRDGRGDI